MDKPSQKLPTVTWPHPPFFKFAEAPIAAGCGCVITLPEGREIEGDLMDFEPGKESVVLRLKQPVSLKRIDIAKIRSIKLTRQDAYLVDAAALDAIGDGDSHRDHQKSFSVTFRDGAELTGKTLGFIKDETGLFLFLVESDAEHISNCFIPAAQIGDVQIGPLLGDTLIGKQVVTADTLTQALNKQAKLRQERIGNYLADRAIISADELTRALREQSKRPNVRLGEILVEAQLITDGQLKEALTIQGMHRERRIGDILIEMGAVSVRLIQFALSDKLGIPYVNVRDFKVGIDALEAIETAFAIQHQVLPLLRLRDSLVVAVENPLAIDFAQDLRFRTGLTITPVIANPQDLKARIAKEYASLSGRAVESRAATATAASKGAHRAAPQTNISDLASQLAREATQSGRSGKDASVDARVSENTLVKLINKIIIEAHAQGASDIHIESNGGVSDTRIRFRKDGDLEDYLDLPQTYSNALVSRIKVMAELDIAEHRHPQDGKIDFGKHGPLSIELRVAVIPTANNLEDVVLRILGNAEPLPLDQVGFSERDLQLLEKMISRTYGLMLVCGPTGSGKTTTLHSVLRHINKPDIKIWTAEDPIEITQPGLRQVQVQSKIDWTFAAAMRAFLRADPDVIMVGEMRDAETAKIGIEASLTGHMVFSTLHTNSAAESVVRLLDLGMDPFNFADALIGILSQRLARKLCPSCKLAHVATEEEVADLLGEYCNETSLDPQAVLSRWKAEYGQDGHLLLREAVGCDACRQGYSGRVVVYELLEGTTEVKHLVRSRATVPQVLAAAQASGMLSLRQNAIEKVLRGVLDLTSARAVSS